MQNNNKQIVIRPFAEKDYQGVIALWQLTGIPCKPEGRDSKEKILKEITNPGTLLLIAEQEGRVIGVVLATHDYRKGWINRLAVQPEHQARGLASRLLVEAENHLYDCGMEIITCLIEEYNRHSMDFFQHKGYVEHRDIIYFSKRKYPDV
ncbi:MAG: GNAT family N-acetyltransferase [Candidatus Aminicenantes bacterium]|nr:GNAT family N-acetyltransferase [Candidatus Aminicenantes bacterium]